jgi:hypothetical protein
MNKIKFSSISAVNLVCPMGCENGVGGVLLLVKIGKKRRFANRHCCCAFLLPVFI